MTAKQKGSLILVYGIVLAVFTLLFFIIPFTRTAAVWTAFAFGEISIILGCVISNYAFDNRDGLKSKVYGFPILKISYTYTITQLVFSTIVFIICKNKDIPAWVAAVIGVLLLAFVLIGTIAADNARDIIENVDEHIEQKTRNVTSFKLDVGTLVSSCEDADIKKSLEKFAEKAKYSDPVSSPALSDIENRLFAAVSEIQSLIDSGKYEEISSKLNAADRLLDERNRLCKAEKSRN